MKRKISIIYYLSILFIYQEALTQDSLIHEFTNASFETYVFDSQSGVPNWVNCGSMDQSPPTVHTGSEIYNISHEAQEGKQYISMVTRANNSWEGISQRLNTKLQPGKKYVFTVFLARGDLRSHTAKSLDKVVEFNQPVVLRIYGGHKPCELTELLYSSNVIDHEDWIQYTIELNPTTPVKWISVQCYYHIPVLKPYNGHFLLDNISPIYMK